MATLKEEIIELVKNSTDCNVDELIELFCKLPPGALSYKEIGELFRLVESIDHKNKDIIAVSIILYAFKLYSFKE